jgi:hypothetical protein
VEPVVLAAAEVDWVSPLAEPLVALVLFAAAAVVVVVLLLPQPASRASVEAAATSAKGLLTVGS